MDDEKKIKEKYNKREVKKVQTLEKY